MSDEFEIDVKVVLESMDRRLREVEHKLETIDKWFKEAAIPIYNGTRPYVGIDEPLEDKPDEHLKEKEIKGYNQKNQCSFIPMGTRSLIVVDSGKENSGKIGKIEAKPWNYQIL